MKLYKEGAFLIQGKDVVLNAPDALEAVKSKTGKEVTIDQAKQYLDVIMESDESEPDRKLSTQKASTAPLSAGRTAYKSSSEKTGENTGKSSYEEDTNHIISAVLDEVFQ